MKKYFTLSVLLFLTVAAYCQTYVSGFINANTNWTVANMPYIVTANALVSQGYTLTIDPGVVVKFDTHCALQIDGELIAVGTASSRITFTSNQPSPAAGDWDKLHFSGYCIGATFDANGHYLSGSIMKYADVLYAGGAGYGAVHIESSWPYISQCNVRLSSAAGIYCAGSTFILDSSLVADNTGYGLYFDDFSHFSCGLVINGDTIRNNAYGGLCLGSSSTSCSTLISNCHFISNTLNGAIRDSIGIVHVTIEKNFFMNNAATKLYTNSGIIGFQAGQYIKINENYFYGNVATNGNSGIVSFYEGAVYLAIENNSFVNNSCMHPIEGVLYFAYNYGVQYDTIKCNLFLNNQTTGSGSSGGGVIYFGGYYRPSNGRILNNVFDGNYNNSMQGWSIFYILTQSSDTLEFANNTVKNNSAPSGTGCYFNPYLTTQNELLQIHHNVFYNNTNKFGIELDAPQTNNVNYDFLYMKHNNFDDVNYQIELYNHIPYGSPNVYADSNYWGSTNTAHIDSIISDYFDSTNYSVVYYLPFLIEPVVIDTTCAPSIITSVAAVQKDDDVSKPFPNPFSTTTQIDFAKELSDASLLLYNVFGQKVREIDAINGRHITISKDNLPAGIYIYEVIEKQNKIGNGKLVVE